MTGLIKRLVLLRCPRWWTPNPTLSWLFCSKAKTCVKRGKKRRTAQSERSAAFSVKGPLVAGTQALDDLAEEALGVAEQHESLVQVVEVVVNAGKADGH